MEWLVPIAGHCAATSSHHLKTTPSVSGIIVACTSGTYSIFRQYLASGGHMGSNVVGRGSFYARQRKAVRRAESTEGTSAPLLGVQFVLVRYVPEMSTSGNYLCRLATLLHRNVDLFRRPIWQHCFDGWQSAEAYQTKVLKQD